ncbi:Protein of uncharacterised function (DUF3577) [Serratia marcescens]|nr:DUF3577 domain-containing protein [Serratia marcescens]CUZ20822.1 Protein of uncharacterised function (DUF3577) [Serratia marcescens]CUZ80318.1 Protein of uncharacterised function (DUF3577) [Serratia marcescens]CVA05911.1 Protein of uncharacterised function (DUF3577) [Serratia marcescens]CVA28457.1 Protein of uncharacterised function (DUF3577) [Serratia marcescens]CVG61698.1 Protein of uncharacterised function (DUF3577) [Serratia marcescens]
MTPKKGEPFLCCDIAALRGETSNAEHTWFDCRVSGKEAQKLVRRCIDAYEQKRKVLIQFRLGDLYADTFELTVKRFTGQNAKLNPSQRQPHRQQSLYRSSDAQHSPCRGNSPSGRFPGLLPERRMMNTVLNSREEALNRDKLIIPPRWKVKCVFKARAARSSCWRILRSRPSAFNYEIPAVVN